MTETLPTLSYEVHVKRGPRQWTVVEVFAEREAALSFARARQPGHNAVRVTIERFDERTNTYQSTVAYEWAAPKHLRPPPTVVARSERITAPPVKQTVPQSRSFWHYLNAMWHRIID